MATATVTFATNKTLVEGTVGIIRKTSAGVISIQWPMYRQILNHTGSSLESIIFLCQDKN
jgi:hypothetical protein